MTGAAKPRPEQPLIRGRGSPNHLIIREGEGAFGRLARDAVEICVRCGGLPRQRFLHPV